MNRLLLVVIVSVVYLLHQDVWLWDHARPLLFGFLPVGLAYHAAYCLVVTGLMWGLTRVAWPAHLEGAAPEGAGSLRSVETPGGPPAKASARSRPSAKREGGRR